MFWMQRHNYLRPLRVVRIRSNQLFTLLVKTSDHVLWHHLTGGLVGQPSQQVDVFRLYHVATITLGPQPELGHQAVQKSGK